MEDGERIVRAAEQFMRNVSKRAKDSKVPLTHVSWNELGRVLPESPIQEFKISAFGSTTQVYSIDTVDFLNASRRDFAAIARLQGREGDIVRNMLSFKPMN
jgi:hypothetical protein